MGTPVRRRDFLVGVALAACTGRRRDGVVVVHEPGQGDMVPEALRGRAEVRGLDQQLPSGELRRTVVVAGHSQPPTYLGRSAAEIAGVVSRLRPELVVLDTCFGASLPLLEALERELPSVFVVAAPFWIGAAGLLYGEAFLGSGPCEARAAAVASKGPRRLFRGRLDARALSAAAAARPLAPELEAPGLARVPFGEVGDVLVVLGEP